MITTRGVLCLVGLIAFAAVGCRSAEASREISTVAAPVGSAVPAAVATTVVLVADLGEADEKCGCGEIIQAVRAAAKRGVNTKEIDTRTSKDDAKKYRVLVVPSVVFLDASGNELRRYEGESGDGIKKLKADLDSVASAKK